MATETTAVAIPEGFLDGGDASPDAEHQEAMINKADAGTNVAGQAPAPLLAGKYKTPEDLHKGTMELLTKQYGSAEAAYKALESGKAATPTSEVDPNADPAQADPNTAEADPNAADETDPNADAGDEIDTTKYSEEFATKGELSPESYEELAEQGYSRSELDTYFAGVQAQTAQLKALAGGEENYALMGQWAVNGGITPAELKAYDDAMHSGDMGRIRQAVTALNSQYIAANGSPTSRRLQPGAVNPATPAVQGYGSWAECSADMADPRYSKDPAFVKQVETKLAASKF